MTRCRRPVLLALLLASCAGTEQGGLKTGAPAAQEDPVAAMQAEARALQNEANLLYAERKGLAHEQEELRAQLTTAAPEQRDLLRVTLSQLEQRTRALDRRIAKQQHRTEAAMDELAALIPGGENDRRTALQPSLARLKDAQHALRRAPKAYTREVTASSFASASDLDLVVQAAGARPPRSLSPQQRATLDSAAEHLRAGRTQDAQTALATFARSYRDDPTPALMYVAGHGALPDEMRDPAARVAELDRLQATLRHEMDDLGAQAKHTGGAGAIRVMPLDTSALVLRRLRPVAMSERGVRDYLEALAACSDRVAQARARALTGLQRAAHDYRAFATLVRARHDALMAANRNMK